MNANQQMVDQLFRRVEKYIDDYKDIFLPKILDDLGKETIEHSINTHEYQNRTGALEKSHDYAVILPGQTVEFNVKTRDGSFDIPLSSPSDEIHLVIGTHQQYGFWVEVRNGFSVLINSWLKLKNEFYKSFAGRYKTRRIF